MNLIKIIMIVTITLVQIQGVEMDKIKKVWEGIVNYWKKHDTKLIIDQGDKDIEILALEKKYNITFPNELKYSLHKNYQNSRQGRNVLQYPWFGSNVGIDLLSIEEIEESYAFSMKYAGLDATKLAHISTIYIGEIQSYKNTLVWNHEWIPIVSNDDIPITIFIDLDTKSKNYLKLIALWDGHLDGVGEHFRFALIADSYIEFMEELYNMFMSYQEKNNHRMEETESGKGFEFFYYEQKFQFPKGFWTDKYREDMIKKMGLK